jgi:hypothetical protein
VREIMSQEVLGSSPVGGDHNDDLADALDQWCFDPMCPPAQASPPPRPIAEMHAGTPALVSRWRKAAAAKWCMSSSRWFRHWKVYVLHYF